MTIVQAGQKPPEVAYLDVPQDADESSDKQGASQGEEMAGE